MSGPIPRRKKNKVHKIIKSSPKMKQKFFVRVEWVKRTSGWADE